MEKELILDVKDLKVSFHTYAGEVKAVRGVSFQLHKGETLALVGESGCGKTVTSKAILRLLKEPPAEIKEESIIDFMGEDVTKMSKERLQEYKGADVAMIFQDPMTSLNPTMTVGNQITESLKIHRKEMDKEARKKEALRLLELVGIPSPESRVDQYPHQLSGGLRQRVMIAIALACDPKILIADEPTTALDVTIQAQILDLLDELKERLNTAIILITHDLGVVANFADEIQVMYAGEVMEKGTVEEIFRKAHHPYSWALLRSVPKISTDGSEHLYSLQGTPPDLIMDIHGCPFADRCDYAMKICKEQSPPRTDFSETHHCFCWLDHPDAPDVERPI
ncbi:MAG: ABC transporter ATP-binding protein [Tissierellia bacterium]|nr:ABC transporter ATP-binding protein [Tissierellia bacterium]